MNYLALQNNDLIPGLLATVEEFREVRAIETKMLDGSYTVQTIGSPAKRLDIAFYCARDTRRLIETLQAENGYLRVFWRDREYTVILTADDLIHKRWSKRRPDLEEKVSFGALVVSEVVRE